MSIKHYLKRIMADPTAIGLLVSNGLTLILALVEGWKLGLVLVIYWWQNVIVGVMNVVKLVTFPVPEARDGKNPEKIYTAKQVLTGKIAIAAFFAFHYGFFHFGYYNFLKGHFKEVDGLPVLICAGAFFLHHLFSYLYNFKRDTTILALPRLFMFPYMRIVPMHLTIIFGGFITILVEGLFGKTAMGYYGERVVLVLFLLLKTKMDLDMHFLEHDPHLKFFGKTIPGGVPEPRDK